ncbi:hypothetical protein CRUP_023300 [Coryphaenoides rupestris]|nr:hypothetical protein CRUP_023300 [Coryphaenoides rupestris]
MDSSSGSGGGGGSGGLMGGLGSLFGGGSEYSHTELAGVPRAAFGIVNGFRTGLKETQGMPWSKPRNVQIMNLVTRQGASWSNTLGFVALTYSVFGVALEKIRGAEDDLNTVAAGTLAGMVFKSSSGLRAVARGGLAGLALSGAYALYNNWDRLTGSSSSSSRLY